MPRISICRNCWQRVTIRDDLAESARVSCPHCHKEFPLSNLLADASDAGPLAALPPELSPVAEADELQLADELDLAEEPEQPEPEQPEPAAAEGAGLAAGPPGEPESLYLEALEEMEEPAEPAAEAGDGLEPALEEPLPAEELPEPSGAELGPADDLLSLAMEEWGKEEGGPAVSEAELLAGEAGPPETPPEPPAEPGADLDAEAMPALEEPPTAGFDEAAPATGAPAEEPAPPAEGAVAEAAIVEEKPEPAAVTDVLVRSPHSDAEFPLSQLIVAESGEPLGAELAAELSRRILGGPSAAGVEFRPEAMPEIDLGEGASAVAAGAFDFAQPAAAEAAAAPAAPAARPKRRKKKPKSLVRELIGIVLGGAAGLLIAYYGLNIFGGKQYDFVKIPLPGVPHTYEHCPPWWPEWLKPFANSSQASDDQAPEPKRTPPKRLHRQPKTQPGARQVAADPGGATAATMPPAAKPAPKPPEKPKPPARKPIPPGFVGLLDAPTFVSDDLGRALKAAHAEFGCEACNSQGFIMKGDQKVTCEVCQGHPPTGFTPAAFEKFCELGQVAAFVPADPQDARLGNRLMAIRSLLEQVGERPANVSEIGAMAAGHAEARDRPSNGFFFAGTVLSTESDGKLHAAHVKLAGVETLATVVSKEPMPLAADDRVLVLGSLIDKPEENLIGYKAPHPLVVWYGLAAKFQK